MHYPALGPKLELHPQEYPQEYQHIEWNHTMTTNSASINETATTEDGEDAVWSIDLSHGYKDVEAAIYDRLEAMQNDGELGGYWHTDMPGLAEFIQDTHANGVKGGFNQDDLDEAVRDAGDKYIGEDLVEYVGQYLDEDSSPIVAQYAGAIIDAMIHDMKCGGEIAEYQGVWFRSY